jgi:hypothetical protein
VAKSAYGWIPPWAAISQNWKKNADNNLSILICSIIMVYLIIRDQNVYIKRIFFRTALICFLFQDLIDQCVTS